MKARFSKPKHTYRIKKVESDYDGKMGFQVLVDGRPVMVGMGGEYNWFPKRKQAVNFAIEVKHEYGDD